MDGQQIWCHQPHVVSMQQHPDNALAHFYKFMGESITIHGARTALVTFPTVRFLEIYLDMYNSNAISKTIFYCHIIEMFAA